jgi:ribosomal protein S18 acetylase RimI-like enzyme
VTPVPDAEPTIRRATVDDADAIERVQVETWRAAYAGLMPDGAVASFDVEARQRWWREGLAHEPRPGSETLVAELDGAVVGFVSVGACRDEDGPGELYAIYLDSTRWGSGVGRALIERAEESLRASGFAEARLWVLEGNERAERFYRAAGWERDGRKVDDSRARRWWSCATRNAFCKASALRCPPVVSHQQGGKSP